ncbi:MAG TPA: hypothetical protein VIU65_04190 [Pyrinomonadaceae bacterium]
MTAKKVTQNLVALEDLKRQFGDDDSKLLRTLRSLANSKLADAESLIRFHETLLFLRAYPQSANVLKLVDQILKAFGKRVAQLRETEADLSPLDAPEVSGIAGNSVTSNFSYKIVRWLVRKYPAQVSIDWDWMESEDQLGSTLPRFLPLLADDAMVEAHVPFREWLRSAKGRKSEIVWLIEQFEALEIPYKRKAELYESLQLHVTWEFGRAAARTNMRLLRKKVFFHRQPLIKRREVSLTSELNGPAIPMEKLTRADGERILDMARQTSAVRYRELHGFTHGDAARVLRAELGRGTEAFVMGVPAETRLPLRAYHAALILKNGVPVAYFEGLSIFERMESGFNLYYTFRDGETAWLYARILRLMHQLLGVTVFSIDPYQVGHENEEGIDSGAFWFYRKLGFRPVRPDLMKLTLAEERKMAADPWYRTPARTLRKLAAGSMLFELAPNDTRAWDRFEVRNIGLAVQRRMAREFDGSPQKIRAHSIDLVSRALGLEKGKAGDSLADLSLVLAMIPSLDKWSAQEKSLAAGIVSAKAGADEALYLTKMQKHASLRASLIRFGSRKS